MSSSTPTKTKIKPRKTLSFQTILPFIVVGASSFYAGLLLGTNSVVERSHWDLDCQTQVKKHEATIQKLQRQLKTNNQQPFLDKSQQQPQASDTDARFPSSMAAIAGGMAAVDRSQFISKFDIGVPWQEGNRDNNQVLMLYGHQDALPTTSDPFKAQEAQSNTALPILDDLDVATENCDMLNLILSQPNEKKQCWAMVGQYRSFHLHKFMRLPEERGQKLDSSVPLRLVNRGAQTSGRVSTKVPTMQQTLDFWKLLNNYLGNWDVSIASLKKVAENAAVDNTIIVMVCNHGQSELLMNFACSSHARGFDISNVLVFATDEETLELAQGLGLHAYYDEKTYGDIPKKAAGRYADRTFTAVMMAKVYCVQMTLMLGYDVLFQDVDIVWYKNPLTYFHDKNSPMYNFDVYFQDDGSRGLFYAPYSSNTGFYYIRNCDKTRHFFNSLLMAGDLIASTHSHQIALVSLLSEHASLYGLKVKVLSRDMDEFPGGHSYHRRADFMKKLAQGNSANTYIFHMSWTENKNNKQKFFKQMGLWYLQETCVGATAEEILRKTKTDKGDKSGGGHLLAPCCSAEPLVTCFYRDKPSITPCTDSPPLVENKKSFW